MTRHLGSKNPNAQLIAPIVREMVRMRYEDHASYREIAEYSGKSRSHAQQVCNGDLWSHIKWEVIKSLASTSRRF